MSETTVGQIVGYLRMDASQWNEEIDKADAKADKLGRKDPKIRIEINAAEVIAKIEAVTGAVDRMDKNNTRLSLNANQSLKKLEKAFGDTGRTATDSATKTESATKRATAAVEQETAAKTRNAAATSQQGRGMGVLVTAIATLGPALVPLTVGATGLAVGWSAMGAAGVAAIVGIKHEMQAGTAIGQAYTGQIGILRADMYSLGHVAAAGVLGPFEDTVRTLQRLMPTLTGQVRDFSSVTGKTAGNLTAGLLAAFVALEPLMRDVGSYTFGLSQRFEHMMSGPGVVSFGDYVRSVFPQVMADVESIVGAVIHLVAALAPLGGGVLSMLGAFSQVISSIPVDVLSTLATAASSAYLGFKSYGLISGLVTGLGTALRALGFSAEAAATGMTFLTGAAAGIGVVVAIATLAFSANSQAAAANQQAINTLTDALIQSNGAIDEHIRKVQYDALVQSGAIDAAKSLGISLGLVTDAALGNSSAAQEIAKQLGAVTAAQADADSGGKKTGKTMGEVLDATTKLAQGLGLTSGQFGAASQGQKDWAAASQASTTTTDAQTQAHIALASHLGATLAAFQAASDAQKKQRDSAQAATVQMQLENNAAGLLKQTLDALNGKTLSAADAQNAFDSSLVNMGDHVTKTGKKVHFTTTSLQDMSSASVALRGELNGQIHNLQAVVEANGGLANSTGKARAQMVTMRKQVIDNAVAHGVDRAAVTAYIDKLLAIPKKVPPTKLDVDQAAALLKIQGLQTAINSLTGKTVTIYTQAKITGSAAAVAAAMNTANAYATGSAYGTGAKPPKKAAGGAIVGPGTGTSDDVPILASNGEFVVTADATSRNKALLEAMNAGKFAKGGMVGYASGGQVGVPVGQYFSDYVSSLGSTVTKAQLVADNNHVADAVVRLHLAEMKLNQDRKKHHVTALQMARDEAAIAKAREALTAATARQGADRSKFAAQQGGILGQFGAGLGIGIRNTGAFIANLEKLSARGYGVLAQQLAAMGNADAEKIAAQAAGASSKTLNSISANIAKGQAQQGILSNINAITAIYGALGKGPATIQSIAASSGLASSEILAALRFIADQLKGNKNAKGLLGQMSLDDLTIARLVAAMAKTQLNATLSVGTANALVGKP